MPEQTLADRLERLIDAQEDIDIAVTEKGGTVTKGLENSDDDIASIPTAELGTKTIDINGTYQASSDHLDGFSSVTVNVANSYSQADNGKVVSNQTLVAQTSATYTKNGTYNTTTKNSVTVAVPPPVSSPSVTLGVGNVRTCMRPFGDTWTAKTWNGSKPEHGDYVWTDGDSIYFSLQSAQYILDKATSTWSSKTWNGFTGFIGSDIWTDGDNIYCSRSSAQYILDKATSTWTAKTWSGLSSFYGSYIWTDGDNIYYSDMTTQYILDKATSTWSRKTWNGLTDFNGSYVWTDGDNIYYSGRFYSSGIPQDFHYTLTKSPYIARSIPSARPTKAITAT